MAKDYTVGGKSYQAMDIDAANDYLYIAALNDSSLPEIIKISTALTSDGETSYASVYGSSVNLMCGSIDSDIVWACGDFGETAKVLRQDDDYWAQVDQNLWYSEVTPILVGPENDDIAMIVVKEEYRMYETYFTGDTGPYWINKSVDSFLPFWVGSMDRLSLIPEQIIIGVDAEDPYYWYPVYWYPVVEYSPSEGSFFADITKSLGFRVTVTTVIYG